jgi:hypothetical protein
VDWRGYVSDCDFNQMLDLPLTSGQDAGERVHLSGLLGADVEGCRSVAAIATSTAGRDRRGGARSEAAE